MEINYWTCKYNDYDEFWDGENELRSYGCAHPDNKSHCCVLNGFHGNLKYDCPFLDAAPKYFETIKASRS